MTLGVTLTLTYPKSAPLLTLKNIDGLRDSTKFKLQKVIETLPKELIKEEQAMIMEIVTACQEVLEEAAEAKAAGRELPTLQEERAAHEEAVAKAMEDQRLEEERKRMSVYLYPLLLNPLDGSFLSFFIKQYPGRS